MSETNEKLAKLAGWDRQRGSDGEWEWRHPDVPGGSFAPPDYVRSIDAQERDLLPLLEAGLCVVHEECIPSILGDEFEWIVTDVDKRSFPGYAPTRAEARAKAILAALT